MYGGGPRDQAAGVETKAWGDASEGQGRLNRRADLAGFLWDMNIKKVGGPQPGQHYQGGCQLMLGLGRAQGQAWLRCSLPFSAPAYPLGADTGDLDLPAAVSSSHLAEVKEVS